MYYHSVYAAPATSPWSRGTSEMFSPPGLESTGVTWISMRGDFKSTLLICFQRAGPQKFIKIHAFVELLLRESVHWKDRLPHHHSWRSVPQSSKGLGVTRWAGPLRSEVSSQPDRQMEESGQHLKDETGVKDGPALVLWQSGIWMRPNTGVTKGATITMEFFNCFFFFCACCFRGWRWNNCRINR